MSTSWLVVDDDPNIRELIRFYLSKEGFRVTEAADGEEALRILKQTDIDGVITDVMMPKMDGFELCQKIREICDIPVLIVTAKGEPVHRIRGFELGTDDYIVKPFEPMELVMRVKALMKRYRNASSGTIRVGDITIDRQAYEVRCRDQRLTLPNKEFELLLMLASHTGQIMTRDQLIEQVWGYDFEGDERTVDVHIKRIREKLESVTNTVKIATKWGKGYRLEADTP